jgi:hypothetical protein
LAQICSLVPFLFWHWPREIGAFLFVAWPTMQKKS